MSAYPIEKGKHNRITVRIPAELMRRMRAAMKSLGLSRPEIVRAAFKEFFASL